MRRHKRGRALKADIQEVGHLLYNFYRKDWYKTSAKASHIFNALRQASVEHPIENPKKVKAEKAMVKFFEAKARATRYLEQAIKALK